MNPAAAQCAALAKAGKVFGTGTEDADALTFGTPILVHPLAPMTEVARWCPRKCYIM